MFWFGLLVVALATCQAEAKKPPGKEDPQAKADQAVAAGQILRRNCSRCHRGEGSESGYAFNVANVKTLIENSVISAGNPDESELFRRIFRGSMPPRNQTQLPRPSPEDAATIKKWIEAGAPEYPAPTPRQPITLKQLLETIRGHFTRLDAADRGHIRYFTLTHLHNDPGVEDTHLRMVRAGLAKALNTLSWEPHLVVPEAVDKEQTVFAVDLDKLGWKRGHWTGLLAEYPYGLAFGSHDNRDLKKIDDDLRLLAGRDGQLLHVRADWFVSVGLKPRLYHELLYELVLPDLIQRPVDSKLPDNPRRMTARDLEDYLKVNVGENIFADRPRAQRAGYTNSGISGQNRMVERHPLKGRGGYWKSYDFLASTRESVLSEFPLGPIAMGNRFPQLAFKHDGGEILFNLPNGLQGYLLATGEGNRLNAGPIEIVGDSLRTSGNQLIVNGLSCIVCHRHGMIETPDDEIRGFAGAHGRARDYMERLYPEAKQMSQLIENDRRLFLGSLEEIVGRFLRVGPDEKVKLKDFPEPVGETSRRFLLEPPNLATIACELYEPDAARLGQRIADDPILRGLGLGSLRKEGGTIQRAAWESKRAYSLMQETARQLGYTPRD